MTNNESFDYDGFLSCSHRDKEIVHALAERGAGVAGRLGDSHGGLDRDDDRSRGGEVPDARHVHVPGLL